MVWYGMLRKGAPGRLPSSVYLNSLSVIFVDTNLEASSGPSISSGGKPVYDRLPSLKQLSVDVSHVPPEASSAAQHEVTILSRIQRQDTTSAESSAALNRCIQPALRMLGTGTASTQVGLGAHSSSMSLQVHQAWQLQLYCSKQPTSLRTWNGQACT